MISLGEIARSTLHQFTFYSLRRVLEGEDIADLLWNDDGGFKTTKTTIKEINKQPCFVYLIDDIPVFYLLPSLEGLGDYKCYYRIGKLGQSIAPLVVLELNLLANRGAICTMPSVTTDGSYDTSVLGMYYSFECKRTSLLTRKRFLKLLAPIQNEVSYKLSMQITRLANFLESSQAINEEFMYYDDGDEGEQGSGAVY